jgi:hypothetical protein
MLYKSTFAIISLTAIFSVQGAINLTPSVTEYVSLGIKYRQLIFQDDKRRIEYELPSGWGFDGSSNQLHLKPPGKSFAEAVITAAPLDKPQPLDDNAVKLLEQQVVAGLPVGSQFAKVEEEIANPVLLNGNASFEVTVSYQLTGEKFFRSAIFVNLPSSQLVFRLSARKDDFQALHRDFKVSIFSWHWIEPAEAPPAVAQAAEPASVP